MNIVNLTPHVLNIHTPDGVVDIAPSGAVARVATTRTPGPTVGGVPTFVTTFGAVTGLPDAVPGTVFVVSGIVAGRVPHREDVFCPGELVRGPDGQPIGCNGLSRTAP